MKKQHVLATVLTLAAVGATVWLLWGGSPSGLPAPLAAIEAALPELGSPGTMFAAALDAPPGTPGKEGTNAALAESEVDRLWPHVRKGEPTEEQRAKVRAEWATLSAQHPDNIYLPNEFRPALSADASKAVRQQLDDTTALVARQAAQKHADRFAPPSAGNPPEVTEQQARASGVTPEQQRNYFDYQIKELESRIQLAELYLASDDPGATKKTEAKKEWATWKKELEALIRTRAQVPSS